MKTLVYPRSWNQMDVFKLCLFINHLKYSSLQSLFKTRAKVGEFKSCFVVIEERICWKRLLRNEAPQIFQSKQQITSGKLYLFSSCFQAASVSVTGNAETVIAAAVRMCYCVIKIVFCSFSILFSQRVKKTHYSSPSGPSADYCTFLWQKIYESHSSVLVSRIDRVWVTYNIHLKTHL